MTLEVEKIITGTGQPPAAPEPEPEESLVGKREDSDDDTDPSVQTNPSFHS